MSEVLRRHKVLIILLSLLLFAVLIWLLLSRQDVGKLPSRGVFVYAARLSEAPFMLYGGY